MIDGDWPTAGLESRDLIANPLEFKLKKFLPKIRSGPKIIELIDGPLLL